MGVLTLILVFLIIVFVRGLMESREEKLSSQYQYWLKTIGVLGLVVGIFGQLIGLHVALSVMEEVQGVAPAILAGGLKVSLVTTIYGLLIYILHLLCSMILKKKQYLNYMVFSSNR